MSVMYDEATFVMPNHLDDKDQSKKQLLLSVNGILQQTDNHWHLVIIDDSSPNLEAKDFLEHIKQMSPERITIIPLEVNCGPGACRNIGIELAVKRNSPIILFNDSDDISHPQRVEITRKTFIEKPDASVIYSTFTPIDESGIPYKYEELPWMIKEILNAHNNPPQGDDVWITMGTKTGYFNLTSTTSVLTDLAHRYPFPSYYISEDTHTWMRYSAGGNKFYYLEEIPSLYFIPKKQAETMTFNRAGSREAYFREMVTNDEEGFLLALKIAEDRGKIDHSLKDLLLIKFKLKSAETLYLASCPTVALEVVDLAMKMSKQITKKVIFEIYHDTLDKLVI